MKFLLDESAESRIAAFLQDQGHDATRIAKDYPAGLSDNEVLELAVAEQRIVITNDSDFGELIFKAQLPHSGVIYFRFPLDSDAFEKIAALRRLLQTHAAHLHEFMVVSPRGVRIGRIR
jgi:predicted nuclease of predicted toxin-antitoxin system